MNKLERKFYNAMVKVNYADTLKHKDIFDCLDLDQRVAFNNDRLFIAFENASKKYLKEN